MRRAVGRRNAVMLHLAGGRRLSPNEWGHPARGEAIDVAVLTHARVRSIPVDRPAFRVIIGGGLAPAVTALIGKLFMSAG